MKVKIESHTTWLFCKIKFWWINKNKIKNLTNKKPYEKHNFGWFCGWWWFDDADNNDGGNFDDNDVCSYWNWSINWDCIIKNKWGVLIL